MNEEPILAFEWEPNQFNIENYESYSLNIEWWRSIFVNKDSDTKRWYISICNWDDGEGACAEDFNGLEDGEFFDTWQQAAEASEIRYFNFERKQRLNEHSSHIQPG